MRQLLHCVSLFLVSGLFSAADVAAQGILGDLNAHGEVYVNSCKATERKALKASLAALKEPDTEKLWQAIEILLCAPATPAYERQVRQLLASRVGLPTKPRVPIPRSEAGGRHASWSGK